MPNVLNINFCGTGIKATREGVASIEATELFDNSLILSGVGAPSTKDFPTPGTYSTKETDEGPILKKRKLGLNERFYTGKLGAGFIYGAGEDDNIELVMKHIEHALKTSKNKEPWIINLTGFSRGGASAIRAANKIYKYYGDTVSVNLFLTDPTPGLGRKESPRKINIPPNVKNIYFNFSKEMRAIYKPLPIENYVFGGSPNIFIRALEGNHQQQELQFKGEDFHDSALDNQDKLIAFFKANGARELVNLSDDEIDDLNSGYTGFNYSPTVPEPLQQLINELETYSNAIGSDEQTNLIRYQFYLLICELVREYEKVNGNSSQLDNIAIKATELIQNYNPNNLEATEESREEARINFSKAVGMSGVSEHLKSIAATLVGLITGFSFAAAYGAAGFFSGLRQVKTAGLASIPCAGFGYYSGLVKGYNWGKDKIKGHETARKINESLEGLPDEFLEDSFEYK